MKEGNFERPEDSENKEEPITNQQIIKDLYDLRGEEEKHHAFSMTDDDLTVLKYLKSLMEKASESIPEVLEGIPGAMQTEKDRYRQLYQVALLMSQGSNPNIEDIARKVGIDKKAVERKIDLLKRLPEKLKKEQGQ